MLLLISFVWLVVLSVTNLTSLTHSKKESIVGVIVNINLIMFYAAPLSTIRQVIQTKDSSSIHRLLLTMMFFNSIFWCVYALAISDLVIFFPNACGFVFGLVQAALCILYPSWETINSSSKSSGHGVQFHYNQIASNKSIINVESPKQK